MWKEDGNQKVLIFGKSRKLIILLMQVKVMIGPKLKQNFVRTALLDQALT